MFVISKLCLPPTTYQYTHVKIVSAAPWGREETLKFSLDKVTFVQISGICKCNMDGVDDGKLARVKLSIFIWVTYITTNKA